MLILSSVTAMVIVFVLGIKFYPVRADEFSSSKKNRTSNAQFVDQRQFTQELDQSFSNLGQQRPDLGAHSAGRRR